MRIIGGKHRGLKLYTLDGLNTRPTLDRIKESLFNIIQNRMENAVVLDLFAGSGSLGLESLSRGASKAVLCDSYREAIKIITKNIEKTKEKSNIELYNCDYKNALKLQNKEEFDIIFLDPPYESVYIKDSINKIYEYNLLKKDGMIIAETDKKNFFEENLKNYDFLELYDIRNYGRVYLLFIKFKNDI